MATPAASPPSSLAPLLQFPPFHPVPFPEDKFLSIKSRSAETYATVRADVLQRSAELRAQLLRRRQHRAGPQAAPSSGAPATAGDEGDGELLPSAPPLPLTPHQAEELLLLTKKVEGLVHHQGFLLTDELVWRMFHLCIQCGAPRLALKAWLHGHVLAEKRGPPYPLFALTDLAALLRCAVLPRLPESGSTLTCSSAVLTAATHMRATEAFSGRSGSARASVGLEDGLDAAQRYLELQRRGSSAPELEDGEQEVGDAEDDAGGPGGAAQQYRAHLLGEYVWPVWRAMEGMQLTLAELRRRDAAAEDDSVHDELDASESNGATRTGGGEGTSSGNAGPPVWLPSVTEQTRVARAALMSVTPLYSFHAPPSTSPAAHAADAASGAARAAALRAQALLCNHPPHFTSEAAAILAPLQALLNAWLTVAQCAAEAKDTTLLLAVHRAVCLGFLSPAATDGAAEQSAAALVRINEGAWCNYAAPDSDEAAAEGTHRHAAEQQARAVVREFVNSSLSVLQFGLLGAEQDALLWLLHDTAALVAGAAATLRRELLRCSNAFAAGSAEARTPSRMCAVAAAHPNAMGGEAENERRLGLLQTVLPAALRSCLGAAALHAHADPEHVSAVAATQAFLRSAVTEAPASNGAANAFAEAALYIGLATGDEALLTCGAAADAGAVVPDSDAPRESPAAALLLNSRALQACRRAVPRLQAGGPDEGEAGTPPAEDVWAEWSAAVAGIAAAVAAPSSESAAAHLDGCLQALVLHATRLQLERVTAYVRLAEQPAAAPSAAAAEDGTEAEGLVEGADEVEINAYARAEAEQTRQTAVEEAWAALQHTTVATVQGALARAEELLKEFAFTSTEPMHCLSPASLGTLAVLARLGTYIEEAAKEAEAEADPADAAAEVSAAVDRVMARVVRDTCTLLCSAAAGPDKTAATASVVGNWVQWVLVTLMARRAWADVLAVLRALDGGEAGDAAQSLLCSTTVDPAVFAALYARAMEDGAASVCAFLRPRREQLFF